MTQSPPPPEDRLAQAVALAKTMAEDIERLGDNAGGQLVALSHRADTNRRLIYVTIGSVMLDAMLTVAIALGGFQISHLTHRLDVAQTVQRQKALCPLYQVFLDSKSKAAREAAPDPVKYDHAFEVIQEGYTVLECKRFITDQ